MFCYNHSLAQLCLMIETVSQVSDVALWLFVCLQNCKNYYTPNHSANNKKKCGKYGFKPIR